MNTVELILIAATIIIATWVAILESKIRVFDAFLAELAKKLEECIEEESKNDGN